MTDLNKPVKRRTNARQFERGQHRRIVVTLSPENGFELRLSGTRRTFTLPIEAAYAIAVKAHLRAQEAEKRALKKGRKSR